jgi:hypothetical protein
MLFQVTRSNFVYTDMIIIIVLNKIIDRHISHLSVFVSLQSQKNVWIDQFLCWIVLKRSEHSEMSEMCLKITEPYLIMSEQMT